MAKKFYDHRDVKWPGSWLIEQRHIQGVPEIPNNRTLFIQQLTEEAPAEPEFVEDCETINDVFAKFSPSKTVSMENEDGIPMETDLQFKSLMDFGKDGIVQQSELLQELNADKEMYTDFIKRVRSITILQKLLNDPEAKTAYLDYIAKQIEELEEADPEE